MKNLIVAVLAVLFLSACNEADKALIKLEQQIMVMPESSDYKTDFDGHWHESKALHKQTMLKLFKDLGDKNFSTTNAKNFISTITKVIKLNTNYLEKAAKFYEKKFSENKRVKKVLNHQVLYELLYYRSVIFYYESVNKEVDNGSDPFSAMENAGKYIQSAMNDLIAANASRTINLSGAYNKHKELLTPLYEYFKKTFPLYKLDENYHLLHHNKYSKGIEVKFKSGSKTLYPGSFAIKQDQDTMETSTVLHIKDGKILLSDRKWYTPEQVHFAKEVDYSAVIERDGQASSLKITHEAKGQYLAKDGKWYKTIYKLGRGEDNHHFKYQDKVVCLVCEEKIYQRVYNTTPKYIQLNDLGWYKHEDLVKKQEVDDQVQSSLYIIQTKMSLYHNFFPFFDKDGEWSKVKKDISYAVSKYRKSTKALSEITMTILNVLNNNLKQISDHFYYDKKPAGTNLYANTIEMHLALERIFLSLLILEVESYGDKTISQDEKSKLLQQKLDSYFLQQKEFLPLRFSHGIAYKLSYLSLLEKTLKNYSVKIRYTLPTPNIQLNKSDLDISKFTALLKRHSSREKKNQLILNFYRKKEKQLSSNNVIELLKLVENGEKVRQRIATHFYASRLHKFNADKFIQIFKIFPKHGNYTNSLIRSVITMWPKIVTVETFSRLRQATSNSGYLHELVKQENMYDLITQKFITNPSTTIDNFSTLKAEKALQLLTFNEALYIYYLRRYRSFTEKDVQKILDIIGKHRFGNAHLYSLYVNDHWNEYQIEQL